MEYKFIDQGMVTEDLSDAVTQLFNQLNDRLKQQPLPNIYEDNSIIFITCSDGEQLIGMASMALYKVISGYKGMVEDVVVDNAYRGKGIGRKLMEKLLAAGKEKDLDEILLFSGHHRTAAINLYKSLGFVKKDSGLYRMVLD